MTHPTPTTLTNWLSDTLRPLDDVLFAHIAESYLAYEDKTAFLGALYAHDAKRYAPLAETLMLYTDAMLNATDRAYAIRRANQHYYINTDGPIVTWAGADDFDVFAWAGEYAAQFDMHIREVTIDDEKGDPRTITELHFGDKVVPCNEWGTIDGWSGAWSLREVGKLINYARYGRMDIIPPRCITFVPRIPDYSKANAFRLSDISSLIYHNEPYVRRVLSEMGFSEIRWIDDEKSHTQGAVAASDDLRVLVFRGTEITQPRDVLTDIDFFKGDLLVADVDLGDIHNGFGRAYSTVADRVEAALDEVSSPEDTRPLFITGHSLGAALAQVAAITLHVHGWDIAGVYTYGSPRVGNDAFVEAYNRHLGECTYLHMNGNDIVTAFPKIRYAHAGHLHLRFRTRPGEKAHALDVLDLNITLDDDLDAFAQVNDFLAPADDAPRSIDAVVRQLEASHEFLHVQALTQEIQGASYSSEFTQGALADHSLANYIFKLACSLIDDRFDD